MYKIKKWNENEIVPPGEMMNNGLSITDIAYLFFALMYSNVWQRG